jgi:hypothetical protein
VYDERNVIFSLVTLSIVSWAVGISWLLFSLMISGQEEVFEVVYDTNEYR